MKYFYDFSEENIIKEGINLTVTFNDIAMICNVVITDKNILFFEDITKNNVLKSSRVVNLLSEYNLIYKESLNDIKFEVQEDNTIIETKDKNIIIINAFNIK